MCAYIYIHWMYTVYIWYTRLDRMLDSWFVCILVCLLGCLCACLFLQSTACISSFLTDQRISFRSDGCERRWCPVTWRVRGCYEVSKARGISVDWCIATSAQNGCCILNKNCGFKQHLLWTTKHLHWIYIISVFGQFKLHWCKEKRCC